MKIEDILRMAREAGLIEMDHDCIEGVPIKKLPAFAALVAEAEREECAKLCSQLADEFKDDLRQQFALDTAVAAIRFRRFQ